MNRQSALLAAAATLGLIAAIAYGSYGIIQRNATNAAKEQERKAVVELTFRQDELTQPENQSLSAAVEWTGNVTAADQVVVKSKVSGTLTKLAVAEGDSVKQGQTLAGVSVADAGSRLAERNAVLQGAQSAVKAAQAQHDSNIRLAEKNFISAVAVEASRNQLDTARAQLRSAQATLDTANTALNEAVVIAPISGKVIKRQITLGEKVSPEQPLLVVSSTQKLEVVGAVGLHQISKLFTGQAVRVSIEGIANPINAKVQRVGPAAESGTRAMPVVVRFDSGTEGVSPGQFANLQVVVVDANRSLTVPVAAVQTERGQPTIWLLENNQLKRRVIKLGKRDANGQVVEVLEGLTASDTLLGSRFDNLRDGQKASVIAAAK